MYTELILKYEGMLSHSFDRFYVVMKFVLPMLEDLKFSTIEFDPNCSYLDVILNKNKFLIQYISNIRNFYKKIVSFVEFYKEQIGYYIHTAHEILTKKNLFDTANVSKRKEGKEEYYCFVSMRLHWFGI